MTQLEHVANATITARVG